MSELIKIVAVAIVTVFAVILVKQNRPEIAILISIVGGLVIILLAMNSLKLVVGSFAKIFQTTGMSGSLLIPLFKILAIGYTAEFGANICADAGINSLSDKVLFSAKLMILIVALPIINTVIDMVVELL